MQIVIDIPKENYQNLKVKDKFDDMCLNYYEKLIVRGIPLPKGHGRIIDESKITKTYWETVDLDAPTSPVLIHKNRDTIFKGSNAPTIIEADKVESEDRRMKDTYSMPPLGLFGKRCRIKHVSNMKEGFVYRIVNDGIRSNVWKELPLGRIPNENVMHNHSEDILIVVCDTLIDEDSKLERVRLKDVEIMNEIQGSEV